MSENTSEMERKLAAEIARWKAKDRPLVSFQGKDRQIAEAFAGRDNVDRLQNIKTPTRPFKPKPVFIHYEWWWWEGNLYLGSRWRIEKVENGRRTEHNFTGEIDKELRRLKAQGFTVRRILMGDEKTPAFANKQTSERKALLARLGSIRV